MSVRIAGREYRIKKVHGRLFLNGQERRVIAHHDVGRIDVSDFHRDVDLFAALAQAVSETCEMATAVKVSFD